MSQYFWNLLIAIDQFFNALFGGFPDETISSRMGKRAQKGDRFGILLCRFLNLLDKNHCEKSIEKDEGYPI